VHAVSWTSTQKYIIIIVKRQLGKYNPPSSVKDKAKLVFLTDERYHSLCQTVIALITVMFK
jgi:hypothetical protein